MGSLTVAILSHDDLERAKLTANVRPGTETPLHERLFRIGAEYVASVKGVMVTKEMPERGQLQAEFDDGADVEALKDDIRAALAQCVPVGTIVGDREPAYLKRPHRRADRMHSA